MKICKIHNFSIYYSKLISGLHDIRAEQFRPDRWNKLQLRASEGSSFYLSLSFPFSTYFHLISSSALRLSQRLVITHE